MAIPNKLVSLTFLCFLLALQDYQLVQEAARLPGGRRENHRRLLGDDESNKGAIRKSTPRADGSHYNHNTPESGGSHHISYTAVTASRRSAACGRGTDGRYTSCSADPNNSPKSPDTSSDPLDKYHFNCTKCD